MYQASLFSTFGGLGSKLLYTMLVLTCSYIAPIFFSFCKANWVKVNGTKYQTPCILVIWKNEEEDPLFGSVSSILVSGQEIFFEIEQMEAVFCQHYHAYALSFPSHPSSHQHFLIKQEALICLMVFITAQTFLVHHLCNTLF